MDDQNASTQVKNTPTISVIIPSYNGANRISNALSALAKQSISDFEVIVVIDGSTDNTKEIVQESGSGLELKIIEQSNKGRAGARNAGVQASAGELLVFMDDDMRPIENWLKIHYAHHLKHKDSALVGWVQSDPLLGKTDFDLYMATRSGEWMAACAKVSGPMTHSTLFFTSANCSIPKLLFNQVNGFDASLRDAEDFELGHRLIQQDIKVYFNADCVAWHDDFPDLKKYIQRQRQYRNAWFELIKIKPEILNNTSRFNPNTPTGFKGFIFKLFAHRGWINTANSLIFRILLPQKLRFKFYDYIIASLGRFNMDIHID